MPRVSLVKVASAPLIAAGCFGGILCVFVLAQAPAALSSTGADSQETAAQLTIPEPLSCDQQTWPYMEQRCRDDAKVGTKRLARIISPERAPIPGGKGSTGPTAPTTPDDALPLAPIRDSMAFTVLSPQPMPGGQAFSPVDQAPAVVFRQKDVAPRGANIATIHRVARAPGLTPRIAEQQPKVRKIRTRVAQAEVVRAPRAQFNPPDIAHGLY
jgi:hypothetical protein